jgi:hypothetical protein
MDKNVISIEPWFSNSACVSPGTSSISSHPGLIERDQRCAVRDGAIGATSNSSTDRSDDGCGILDTPGKKLAAVRLGSIEACTG